MKAYIMMGTTLAGKTKHGRELAEKFGFEYVSSGDIARSLMDEATKAEFAEGKLSPHDREIRDVIFRRMWDAHHRGRHIVLDGFPRTPRHAVYMLAKDFPHDFVVINLDVSREVVLARAGERNRDAFDNEATVIKRNEVYLSETAPALLFIASHFGKYVRVVVEKETDPTTIFSRIVAALDAKGLLP